MLAQQRATYPAGKQGNKSASATASTSIPTTVNVPPALTEKALSSLCRLPISNESTLNWQRYDCGTSVEKSKETQAAYEALLQLSLAECRAFNRGASSSTQSSLPLLQSTLWAVERDSPSSTENLHPASPITSIWLFNLQTGDKVAESSSAASSEERREAASCKDKVDYRLSFFKARREQGCCRLQDFYTPLSTASFEDITSLQPSSNNARLLSQFLKALSEHFLARWVWSSSQHQNSELQDVQTGPQGKTPASIASRSQAKAQDKEEGEKDDEEEGAIGDITAGELSQQESKIQYWPKSHRHNSRKAIRFGDGIVLQPLPRSYTLFDRSRHEDRQAVQFTLRSFVDEQGHIYLETRTIRSSGMQYVEDIDISNRKALLGPSGMQALLVERFKDLSWSGRGEDRESEKQALECKRTLLSMLQLRGIDSEELDDDWIVCETQQTGRFLWPTKLCFALPPHQDIDKKTADQQSLPIFVKPLVDLAERAKGLLRESTGVRNVVGNADAMMLDVEEQPDVAGKEDDDDGTDGYDEDQEDEEEENNEKKGPEINAQVGTTGKPALKEEVGEDRSATTLPVAQNKVPTEVDEETDLWGTFGFGLQDSTGKDLDRRQSGAGLDESGFGLITEDDFDFFDEAANGMGAFDDMDVDVGQQGISESRGDATYRSLDTDNGSEMAMTNSTFLDPPSLPGFTPGSLSGTSENDARVLGGLNAKTPRTPFSPSQDMVDAHVSIEGEDDSIYHDPRRFHSNDQDGQFNQMHGALMEPRHQDKTDSNIEESQTWSPQNREHLMSKYEQGKFALPRAPTRKRGDAEEGSEAGSRSEKDIHPRNRLRHRIQSARHSSHGRPTLSRKSKAGHHLLRHEDDMSDLEATVDGTISDRSSLIDEDSDDDMTSASGDTSEEEGLGLKERLSLLQSSIEAVEIFSLTSVQPESNADVGEVVEIDPIKDAKIAKSVKRIAHNPRVRSCVCPVQADKDETIVRSLAKELFSPLPHAAEENTLAVLLSSRYNTRSRAPHKTSFRLLEAPKIMVGCQGAIASMEPTALSLWEKLGLSAVSGPKDVAALALHCGCLPTSWQKDLLEWMGSLRDTFRRSGFGQITLADDTLLALGDSHDTSISQLLVQTLKDAEQWTDTLDSLLSRMYSHLCKGQFVVIYAVGVQVQPHCIWILNKLEADLREVASQRWGTAPNLITIRGIEWKTMATSMRAVTGRSSNFQLALSLYDSLDVPIQPYFNHKDHLPVIRSESIGIVHPSFTLSPVNHQARNQTRFQLQWKSEPFNLADAGLLLHVAYHIGSRPGEPTFMSIMDEKAQGYYVDGWQRTGEIKAELERIWKETQAYAAQARIIWRIVICKRGQMKMDEVKMWSSLLKDRSESLRAVDITLTCLDMLTPLSLILPRQGRSESVDQSSSAVQKRPAAKEIDEKTSHYINARQVDYAIYPPFRIALCQSRSEECILPLQSSATISFSDRYNGCVAASTDEDDKIWSHSAPRHFWLHLLQVYKAPYSNYQDTLSLDDRTDIITRSLHQLTFIARERFLLEDNLPWHVSILAIADRARLLF
jgi:hypothetical protein